MPGPEHAIKRLDVQDVVLVIGEICSDDLIEPFIDGMVFTVEPMQPRYQREYGFDCVSRLRRLTDICDAHSRVPVAESIAWAPDGRTVR